MNNSPFTVKKGVKLRDKLHQNSTETAPSLRTLKNWSKAFNWQKRIEQRDIEIGNKLEKREVVNRI
jgi:hypothetical protein